MASTDVITPGVVFHLSSSGWLKPPPHCKLDATSPDEPPMHQACPTTCHHHTCSNFFQKLECECEPSILLKMCSMSSSPYRCMCSKYSIEHTTFLGYLGPPHMTFPLKGPSLNSPYNECIVSYKALKMTPRGKCGINLTHGFHVFLFGNRAS